MPTSLWAVLRPEHSGAYEREIMRLARMTGGPRFAPHVTLVGSAPADSSDAVARVVAAAAPIEVTFSRLADSDEKFRCITLTAEATPPLVELRDALVATTGAEASAFQPHLSLLYGEFDAAKRAALRSTIGLPLPATAPLDAVWLVDTTHPDAQRWSVEAKWSVP